MHTVALGNHGNKTTSEESGKMSQWCFRKELNGTSQCISQASTKKGLIHTQQFSPPHWTCRSRRGGGDKTNTFLSPVFISALMCRKMKNVNVCFAFTASKRDILIINEALQAIKFGSDIITAICPLSPSSFLWRASAVAKSTALACCHCLTWLWQTIQFQNSSKKHLFKNKYINK